MCNKSVSADLRAVPLSSNKTLYLLPFYSSRFLVIPSMDSTPTNVGNGMEDDIQATSSAPDNEFDIAIIGGGIIGVIVALGLLHRGMRVTVYERGSQFSEIGTGFAFPAIGRECMEALNPSVLEALRRVGEVNRHPQYRYWDGYNPTSKEAAASGDALLFQMSVQDLAYWGCLRSQFLNEMAKELPEGVTQFGKQLESYVDDESSNKVILRFTDGSSAEADGGLLPWALKLDTLNANSIKQ